jgi:hypothetical protein
MSAELEPTNDELLRYLLSEVTVSRSAEIEAWARSDSAAEARLAELRWMIAALESPVPVENLMPGIQARLDRPSLPRPRAVGRNRLLAGVLATAACVVLSVAWLSRPEEFRPKGRAGAPSDWAVVHPSVVTAGQLPAPLGARLHVHDSLLFAYGNAGAAPFSHLLVFAVDSSNRVFWYYPAWTNEADDPEALAISRTEHLIELREQISHELQPGRLVLFTVFARRPVRVSEVERALRDPGAMDPGRRLIPETEQRRFELEVTP